MTDPVRTAEIEILRYLIAHQDARDTIDGIEKWWLPQSGQYGMGAVAAALRRLENSHLIRVWQSASAKPVYGLRSANDPHSLKEYLRTLE